jgi:pimeloyl-ACP methyl ester carboxylesterase
MKSPSTRPVVLVHGAFHGGWCWRHVLSHLRAAGVEAFAPTLSGVGERADCRGGGIGFHDHVNDVVALIEAEELTDVVVVGHSLAGSVITAVADRLGAARVASLFYLDAELPNSGECAIGPLPLHTEIQALLDAHKLDEERLFPPPLEFFGLPAEEVDLRAWQARRLTPHPIRAFTDPIVLKNSVWSGPIVYAVCTHPPSEDGKFLAVSDRLGALPNVLIEKVATSHMAMMTEPVLVSDLILREVRRAA